MTVQNLKLDEKNIVCKCDRVYAISSFRIPKIWVQQGDLFINCNVLNFT